MDGSREFVSFKEAGQDAGPVLGLLRTLAATAVDDAAGFGFAEAADFAGEVEELSRTVEYLQLVAAGAVDRARKLPAATAPAGTTSWATGWRESPGESPGGSPGSAAAAGAAVASNPGGAAAGADASVAAAGTGAVDDGCRNTMEFLRARLRISAAEARRRLSLAGSVLPRPVLAGRQPLPALRAELAEALAAGEVASRSATIIALALDGVRHSCDAAAAAAMEHALTRTAAENDPDFLARIARRWADALDQDGAEPSRAPAPAPGRLHPPHPPRPAPPGNLRDRRPVRTAPHRHEHRHQPPHQRHGAIQRFQRRPGSRARPRPRRLRRRFRRGCPGGRRRDPACRRGRGH
ncbi:DUF222 domain-containing protein [Pseudarthrobacter sp. H2]|uniref:DUF222 domain-containing protein n=1 Tax=Pseudarthrobacter sp. H2 TaxID=3418415 RepID=UPI003CF45151